MKHIQTLLHTKSTFNTIMRYAAVVLPLLIVVLYGITALAYGPERKTFTIAKPADYVTFNSITDNPNYGDERNFVLVKDASNTSAGGWTDEVNVQDGKEYLVRMYVHNNAGANLGLVAKNTRLMANVPTASRLQIMQILRKFGTVLYLRAIKTSSYSLSEVLLVITIT
jgi:hypothetical protein